MSGSLTTGELHTFRYFLDNFQALVEHAQDNFKFRDPPPSLSSNPKTLVVYKYDFLEKPFLSSAVCNAIFISERIIESAPIDIEMVVVSGNDEAVKYETEPEEYDDPLYVWLIIHERAIGKMPSPPEKSSIPMSLTSIPDCPVCLEIPFGKKIFQCQNGHIRCEDCKARATGNTCPVCRIQIEEDIRNISVENVLKGLQQSNNPISQIADLVTARRQRRIRLCRQLGFPTCRFETSIPKDFIDHLISVHGVTETSDKFISVDFCAWSDLPATRLMIFGRKENSQDWLTSNTSFLFVCKQNENGLLVNCICIGRSLDESQSYRTSYYFTSTNVPKCVASWPTLWCSDPAIPGYQISIWDSAYHVSQRTLRSVQGHDDAVNLLVRIKKHSQ